MRPVAVEAGAVPLALVDPVTLAINLGIIIGAVIFGVVLLILVVAAWTGVKLGLWRRSRRQAEQEARRRTHGPDGRPYPPAGRGLCDRCQRALDKVYYLPSGERRCPACYAELPEAPAGSGRPGRGDARRLDGRARAEDAGVRPGDGGVRPGGREEWP